MDYGFKLNSLIVTGLPGFEEKLQVDFNHHLTTLIGPNGSGKTTSLTIIDSVCKFINRGKFDTKVGASDNWLTWKEAEIEYISNIDVENKIPDMQILGKQFKTLKLTVSNFNNNLYLKKIGTENGVLEIHDLNTLYLESQILIDVKKNLDVLKKREKIAIDQINNLKSLKANHSGIPDIQKILDQTRIEIKNTEDLVSIESIEFLNFQSNPLERKNLESFIQGLQLPTAKLIKFGETDFSDIKESIRMIAEIRAGKDPDEKYQDIKKNLTELIQQDPHFYSVPGDKWQNFLSIDGVDYKLVSTGTKICIFYFSLVFETNANSVILWDEPENGLHPTRRYKLLDLILKDSRQFVIATHSTELAPVFDTRCNVIRTHCEHRVTDRKNYISFQKTNDRINAFKVADKLGLSPSRLLFTASVTIWVEGPSDMIFWRKMISIHPEGRNFVEGFDYTFLLYGGKCISHLTALETNEKLDVLNISSHPIFIVDSDISVESQFTNIEDNLKDPAKRMLTSFNNPDFEPGSNLFLYSLGREMENYLPVESLKYSLNMIATSITQIEMQNANFTDADWPRTEKYHEMISRKFTLAMIGKTEDGKFKPKSSSRWGENNKTQVIQTAIEMPGLTLEMLKYGGKEQVDQIIELIKRWKV